jgi:hypothetical protein
MTSIDPMSCDAVSEPGEGLADGIGMFMSFCVDAAGVTEGEAIGVGDGFAFCGAGIFMPGIS